MPPSRSSEVWKQELAKRNIAIESDAVLMRCVSFAETYGLELDFFLNRFEAWAISNLKIDSTLTMSSKNISEFLDFELNQPKENIKSTNTISSSTNPKHLPVSSRATTASVGEERTIKITDLIVWPAGCRIDAMTSPIASPEISLLFDVSFLDKYMRIIWPKVAKHINERIEEFARLIQKDEETQWAHPAVLALEPVCCYGRLIPENDSVKWNERSILLETSRELGSGCRVALQLNDLSSFSLIPGQVVGLRGLPMIDGFHVAELLKIRPLDRPVSTVSEIPTKHFDAVNIFCASGPFALIKKSGAGPFSLDYTSLDLLFKHICNGNKPSCPVVLLLCGPFIDADTLATVAHSEIASQHASFEDIFKEEISSRLSKFLQTSPKSKVILIPSPNDIMHDYVFPQGALPRDLLAIPNDVILLPNPCFFCINELVIATSTADIVFDMSCCEISRGMPDIDRMTRLLSHLIHQRSFYPLYPASQHVNLDLCGTDHGQGTTQSNLLAWKVLPDILIVPSALRQFVRVVEDVLCINPGTFVSKGGHSMGSFGHIAIQAFDFSQIDAEVVPHFADRRSIVTIKSLN